MPRRHINARERTDKRWSEDYIRSLMQKLRAEREEEEPEKRTKINKPNRKRKNK